MIKSLFASFSSEKEESLNRLFANLTQLPVAGASVAFFRDRGAEIAEHVHTHRAGAAAFVADGFDALDQRAQSEMLARANFRQGVPNFRFQPHGGAAATGNDVSID
jgi:hypothetical protein